MVLLMARCEPCDMDVPFTSFLSRMRWMSLHRKAHPKARDDIIWTYTVHVKEEP